RSVSKKSLFSNGFPSKNKKLATRQLFILLKPNNQTILFCCQNFSFSMRFCLFSQGLSQSHAFSMPISPSPPQLPAIVLRCNRKPEAIPITTSKNRPKVSKNRVIAASAYSVRKGLNASDASSVKPSSVLTTNNAAILYRFAKAIASSDGITFSAVAYPSAVIHDGCNTVADRSEERRVGKEG